MAVIDNKQCPHSKRRSPRARHVVVWWLPKIDINTAVHLNTYLKLTDYLQFSYPTIIINEETLMAINIRLCAEIGIIHVKENKSAASAFTFFVLSITAQPTTLIRQARMTINDSTDMTTKSYSKFNEEEEILKDNPRRFCLFPIKYHEVYIQWYVGNGLFMLSDRL